MGWWRGALLLAAALALARADVERRADMSPVPFVMGSRYGRSPEPRLMSARNDRFFMSSRYGKRSEAGGGASLVRGVETGSASSARDTSAGGGAGARALVCEFTGVFPLYRCVRRELLARARPAYHKRSSEESSAGDKE